MIKGTGKRKIDIFKELTPRSRTYELRSQGGKKSIYKIKDKHTPHTVLQKLSPKPSPAPLMDPKDIKIKNLSHQFLFWIDTNLLINTAVFCYIQSTKRTCLTLNGVEILSFRYWCFEQVQFVLFD